MCCLCVFVWQKNKHTLKTFLFFPSLPLFASLNGGSSQQTESSGQIQGVAGTSSAGVEITNEKQGKKKNKTAGKVTLKPDPLDQTCIHPESYDIAMR